MTKIMVYPNKILRKRAEAINRLDLVTKKEIGNLVKELEQGENAAGLAAPQLGISKDFFGIKRSNKKVEVFINPKIVKTWGNRVYPVMIDKEGKEEYFLEGCLSVPDYFGTVKRFLRIKVTWQEIEGNNLVTKVKDLSGYDAVVWQHESDHLLGRLFIDYIKKDRDKFYKWNGMEMVLADIDKIKLD